MLRRRGFWEQTQLTTSQPLGTPLRHTTSKQSKQQHPLLRDPGWYCYKRSDSARPLHTCIEFMERYPPPVQLSLLPPLYVRMNTPRHWLKLTYTNYSRARSSGLVSNQWLPQHIWIQPHLACLSTSRHFWGKKQPCWEPSHNGDRWGVWQWTLEFRTRHAALPWYALFHEQGA